MLQKTNNLFMGNTNLLTDIRKVCGDISFLDTVLVVKELFMVLLIALPIILILVFIIELSKYIVAGDTEPEKVKRYGKKICISFLLFFFRLY